MIPVGRYFIPGFIMILLPLLVLPKDLQFILYPLGLGAFFLMFLGLNDLMNMSLDDRNKTKESKPITDETWKKTVKRHNDHDDNNRILNKYNAMPFLKDGVEG